MKTRTRKLKPRPKKVTLTWYARTDRGWRHFPVIMERKHGAEHPRHGFVMDGEELREYPKGRYELRSYDAKGVKVYTPVEGCHPMLAMAVYRSAQRAAKAVGEARNPQNLIRGAIDAYLGWLAARKKTEMEEKARYVLGEFADFANNPRKALEGIPAWKKKVPPLPITTTRSITGDHILAFHAVMRHKGASERTVADKQQRIKAWLRHSKVDTAFMPPIPTYERKKVSTYTATEIKGIRAVADDYMRMVIDLALKLGLREQEIMHAEWGDIEDHGKVFRVQSKVREKWTFMPKDAEQRMIPIPADLLTVLKSWHESRPKTMLIVGNDADTPEGHFLRKLKTLARKAGLNCGRCEGCQRKGAAAECERWFLHRFRATYLTKIVRMMDLESARKYAGHSDIQTTQLYLEAADAASPETQTAINAIVWE